MIIDCGCCEASITAVNREKKEVALLFKRDELLHDVANNSWVLSEVSASENVNAKQELADIIQDGNIDRVVRVLGLAHQECVDILYPYTHDNIVGGEQMNDVFSDPNNYSIAMRVPTTFSRTSLEYLEHLIHEYLVCRVIEDWVSIVMPDRKVIWTEKLQDIKDKIISCLSRRSGRIRRSQSPF